MRVALILGAILAVTVVGAVDAKSAAANHGVTGGAGYYVVDDFGNRDLYRHFSVTAETGRPNMGNWLWNRPEGNYSGNITCVEQQDGDVWLAGSVTRNGPLGMLALFARIHDGGAGSKGDQIFVWGVQAGDDLTDMNAACHDRVDPSIFGDGAFLYSVVQGNVAVH